MKTTRLKLIFGIILALAAAWIVVSASMTNLMPEEIPSPFKGFKAPGFSLSDESNQSYSLESYQGKPVLVFFWASWCSVCKSVFPDLQAVYPELSDSGFEVLAINATSQDQITSAKEFVSQNGFTFPVLYDLDGSVFTAYQVRGLPTAFLIDSNGIIRDRIIGNGLSRAYLLSQGTILLGGQ